MAVKSTAKKATKSPATIKPLTETLSKSALINRLADHAAIETRHVKAVLASLEATVLAAVHKKGVGEFTLLGLFKVSTAKIPAKPKRKGVNPFTGQEQVFAAKPATVKVKIRPLKKLKDAAA